MFLRIRFLKSLRAKRLRPKSSLLCMDADGEGKVAAADGAGGGEGKGEDAGGESQFTLKRW